MPTDKEKKLLRRAYMNDKILTYSMARSVYEGRAREALKRLESKGYIEHAGIDGKFKVVDVPWDDKQRSIGKVI